MVISHLLKLQTCEQDKKNRKGKRIPSALSSSSSILLAPPPLPQHLASSSSLSFAICPLRFKNIFFFFFFAVSPYPWGAWYIDLCDTESGLLPSRFLPWPVNTITPEASETPELETAAGAASARRDRELRSVDDSVTVLLIFFPFWGWGYDAEEMPQQLVPHGTRFTLCCYF